MTSAYLQLSGSAILLLTLCVFIWQISHLRRQNAALVRSILINAELRLREHVREIDLQFLEYPHLRPRFYGPSNAAVSELDAEDQEREEVLALLLLDLFASIWTIHHETSMIRTIPTLELWSDYAKDMFAASPTLRRVGRDKHHWFSVIPETLLREP